VYTRHEWIQNYHSQIQAWKSTKNKKGGWFGWEVIDWEPRSKVIGSIPSQANNFVTQDCRKINKSPSVRVIVLGNDDGHNYFFGRTHKKLLISIAWVHTAPSLIIVLYSSENLILQLAVANYNNRSFCLWINSRP